MAYMYGVKSPCDRNLNCSVSSGYLIARISSILSLSRDKPMSCMLNFDFGFCDHPFEAKFISDQTQLNPEEYKWFTMLESIQTTIENKI